MFKRSIDCYGVELKIELDYESFIKEIQTRKYYEVWVISGDGSGKLPNGDNSNLVGQFIKCLI